MILNAEHQIENEVLEKKKTLGFLKYKVIKIEIESQHITYTFILQIEYEFSSSLLIVTVIEAKVNIIKQSIYNINTNPSPVGSRCDGYRRIFRSVCEGLPPSGEK